MQVSCWDPRVFIIGGVSKAGELLVGQARATFQARLTPAATGPPPPAVRVAEPARVSGGAVVVPWR